MTTTNGPGGGQWIPPTTPPGYPQPGGTFPSPPNAPPPPAYMPGQPQWGSVGAGLREIAATLGSKTRQVTRDAGNRIRQSGFSINSPERAVASGKNVREVANKAGIFHPFERYDLELHSVEGPAGQAAFASGANVVLVINQLGIEHPVNIQKLLAKAAQGLIFTHGMSIADTDDHLRRALQTAGYPDETIAGLMPDIEQAALREAARREAARWAPQWNLSPGEIAQRMGVSADGERWLRARAAAREIETSSNFSEGNIQLISSKHRVAGAAVMTELSHSAVERGYPIGDVLSVLRLPDTDRARLEAYAVENGPAGHEVRSGANLLYVSQRYDIRIMDETGRIADRSGLVAAAMNGPVRHELRQKLSQPETHMAIAGKFGLPPAAVMHCVMQLAVARDLARPDRFMVPEDARRDLNEICARGPIIWYAQRHGVPLNVAAGAYGLTPTDILPLPRNGL